MSDDVFHAVPLTPSAPPLIQVLKLKGIPPLVALLRSPSAQVRQTASAALRNLSFKNNSSKEQIERCGGISEAVALLRDTDSPETQKQLTGDWNLELVACISSATMQ